MSNRDTQDEVRRVPHSLDLRRTGRRPRPTGTEIKICGLTSPAAAMACVAAGADAIGLVFHPASPRHLTLDQARAITAVLPDHVARVGVFVEQTINEILATATQAGLSAVQLYAAPSEENYVTLARHGLHGVQVLRSTGAELLAQARTVPTSFGLLIECGRGILPGGNGITWNWAEAAGLQAIRPFGVAGGLEAANVSQALTASGAFAVDVSSGVESAPGVKDLAKVTSFIAAVRAARITGRGSVFKGRHACTYRASQ
ncbi:MAG: phosphoribosylanthranilate isomerase [Kiritimatiellia bacterium]